MGYSKGTFNTMPGKNIVLQSASKLLTIIVIIKAKLLCFHSGKFSTEDMFI